MSKYDPPELPPAEPDRALLARLAVIQSGCLAAVVLVAGSVLCAWLLPPFAALLPDGWSLMKANTAVAMLLGVGSLARAGHERLDRVPPRSRVASGAMVLIGGVALFEHLSGRATGLDTLLASDPTSPVPGRMSVQTSVFLILFGIYATLGPGRRQARFSAADALAVSLFALILLILAGYLFGATRLYSQSSYLVASPQTLFCMLLLTSVAVTRRSQEGHLRALLGAGVGSRFARTLLPLAITLPYLLALGRAYVTSTGWLSPAYAAALAATATSLLLVGILIESAWRINRMELRRRMAERAEQSRHHAYELEDAESRERRQIARDLHDELAQILAAAQIRLARLRTSSLDDVRATADEVSELIEEANQSTRSLAARLAPAVLYELGLRPALEWLADEIDRSFGLAVAIEGDAPGRHLPVEARSIVYRAVRELLINAAKHAEAGSATVAMRRAGGSLVVTVSDDGVGFEPAQVAAKRGGFGLIGLRDRLSLIGATLDLRSVPGRGTVATLTVPAGADEPAPAAAQDRPVPEPSEQAL